MPPAGLEPTIPASEQPQTHVLDRVATGIGIESCYYKLEFRAFWDSRMEYGCFHYSFFLIRSGGRISVFVTGPRNVRP